MSVNEVVADNSSDWFPTIQAIQLAHWCDGISLSIMLNVSCIILTSAAAVVLICYDSGMFPPRRRLCLLITRVLETVLVFSREVSPCHTQ